MFYNLSQGQQSATVTHEVRVRARVPIVDLSEF